MISSDKKVQRAGIRPGPERQPATAAEGLAFRADLGQRRRGLFHHGRTAGHSRTRLQRV